MWCKSNNLFLFYFLADPELVGGDTLTCGVCGKDFALADIVKFIQHKVLKNGCTGKKDDGGDGEGMRQDKCKVETCSSPLFRTNQFIICS